MGRLFHHLGPKTANDLSPTDLFVTGMARRVKSLEDLSIPLLKELATSSFKSKQPRVKSILIASHPQIMQQHTILFMFISRLWYGSILTLHTQIYWKTMGVRQQQKARPKRFTCDIAPDNLLKAICCSCKEGGRQCQTMKCSCMKADMSCVSACGVCCGLYSNGPEEQKIQKNLIAMKKNQNKSATCIYFALLQGL